MRRAPVILLLMAASATGCELLLSSPTKIYVDDDGVGGAGDGAADPGTGGEGAVGGSPSDGGGGSGAGPSVGGGGSLPCPGLVDSFWEVPGELGPWCTDNLDDGGALSVADGMLQIDAGDDDWWLGTEQAPFVYQTICGAFSLVTRVSADIGPHPHHGIGVVIRSVEAPHDWALFSLGHQEDGGLIETKLWTYIGGSEGLGLPNVGDHAGASGKLAVCRTTGGEFLFADDVDGANATSYPEPANDFGFGRCVQVGFTVHEWWEPQDDPTAANVRGLVDYLHTQPVVTGPDGCRDVAAWGS